MSEQVKVYDWDDEISNDGNDQYEDILLPEGTYPFEVIKVEKAYYKGSEKVPECNMAKVFLRIDGGDLGTGLCVENLFLTEKNEWRAAQFLRSIGLKKHGEPVNWRMLLRCDGETGRCKIKIDSFENSRTGERAQNNKVDKFFDKEESAAPKKTFEKGKF